MYTIGLKKIKGEYIGYIIEAKDEKSDWQPSQVKMKILNSDSVIYYMGNFSMTEYSNHQFIENKILTFGNITFVKSYPVIKGGNDIVKNYNRELKRLSANKPYFERLNETTTYLRLPSFSRYKKTSY